MQTSQHSNPVAAVPCGSALQSQIVERHSDSARVSDVHVDIPELCQA